MKLSSKNSKAVSKAIIKMLKNIEKENGKEYAFTYTIVNKRRRHVEHFAEPEHAEAFANGLWAGGATNILINGMKKVI